MSKPMADITTRDPWSGLIVGRSFTADQLDRVACERTCEECGRVDLLKKEAGGHGRIDVQHRYVKPYGAGCYRGRFCADCWKGKEESNG